MAVGAESASHVGARTGCCWWRSDVVGPEGANDFAVAFSGLASSGWTVAVAAAVAVGSAALAESIVARLDGDAVSVAAKPVTGGGGGASSWCGASSDSTGSCGTCGSVASLSHIVAFCSCAASTVNVRTTTWPTVDSLCLCTMPAFDSAW